jgi:hypothetical protein
MKKLLKEKQNNKQLLLEVSSKLKGKELFPRKIADAQNFLKKLEHFPS